ncbi:hypothetical protein F4804DRAFT_302528 [Jackrogersella minutella]|nr:hypothetical protein F4804DRAFT_302528 [Jackrogersella minutella]
MEVTGAIASVITICETLAATPKIIEGLRTLVEVKQEVLQLLNEVELLNSLGELIRKTVENLPSDDSIPQPTLLQSVATDLAALVSQLEGITRECQREGKENGQFMVARWKWFRYTPRVASLSERAKKNR